MKYLVCAYCGWISEAYPNDALFAGPGGQLSCPECADAHRCKMIEANGMIYVFDDKDFMQVLASKNRLRTIRKIIDKTEASMGYKPVMGRWKEEWK